MYFYRYILLCLDFILSLHASLTVPRGFFPFKFNEAEICQSRGENDDCENIFYKRFMVGICISVLFLIPVFLVYLCG